MRYLNQFYTKISMPSDLTRSCAAAWYVDGRGFNLPVQQHSFMEIGHEIISMAILLLPLIQEGQLSVPGKRRFTKYWFRSKLAMESYG